MVLNIHLNTLYLSKLQTCSQVSQNFFMGWLPEDGIPIRLNDIIRTISTILKTVTALAIEAEFGILFLNAKEIKILKLTLYKVVFPQTPTPLHSDNSMTVAMLNNTVKQQCSRAMEMRYFWVEDQVQNNNFKSY